MKLAIRFHARGTLSNVSDFLDPQREIAMHGRDLPHWEQAGSMQFVTFRLADSLPMTLLRDWNDERKAWLRLHPEPWTPEVSREYYARFTHRLEEWLDAGRGSCLLRDRGHREAVIKAMTRYDGEKVDQIAWVVMPNHVHALFVPHVNVARLVGAWKSVSARAASLAQMWQKGYRDTLIRSTAHFASVVRYIRKNPERLPSGEFSLWESQRAKQVPNLHR